MRGTARIPTTVQPKVAVTSKQVDALVKAAMDAGEMEVAALMAVALQFLLRLPSEGIPLEREGSHSSVNFESLRAVVAVSRRKNTRTPVTLTRECCCASAGQQLCAVRWLHALRRASGGNGRIFSVSNIILPVPLKGLRATWVFLTTSVLAPTPLARHGARHNRPGVLCGDTDVGWWMDFWCVYGLLAPSAAG